MNEIWGALEHLCRLHVILARPFAKIIVISLPSCVKVLKPCFFFFLRGERELIVISFYPDLYGARSSCVLRRSTEPGCISANEKHTIQPWSSPFIPLQILLSLAHRGSLRSPRKTLRRKSAEKGKWCVPEWITFPKNIRCFSYVLSVGFHWPVTQSFTGKRG